MPKSDNQKQRILLLQNFLLRNTDPDHPATTKDIMDYMEAHDMEASRKTIYSDIAALQESGLDVEIVKGRGGGYYIGSRAFELPELKLLIDAVQSSRFLTEKKSRELIRKLCSLCSQHNESLMRRNIMVSGRVKTMNESIYYNVDAIQEAIATNQSITFRYFGRAVDGSKVFREKTYLASPYALCWSDEYYYLISHTAEHGVTHYRVDKMADIQPTGKPRTPCPELTGEKLAVYSNKVFQMFAGETVTVRLRIHNSLAGVVYDRFGLDSMLIPDGDHFILTTQVAVSPMFLSWVIGFGNKIQILSPQSVIDACQNLCRETLGQYG